MVDWDQVERLRSKGWDWDRVAEDSRVGFHAEDGAGQPGRALRALYYQRRSRAQRRPSKEEGGAGGSKASDAEPGRRWGLARIGYLLAPIFGVWLVLALLFPSPVGTYLPWFPWLLFPFLAFGVLLGFSLLRLIPGERWAPAFRNTLIVGIVLGGVVAGTFGLVATLNGCPTLPSASTSEPSGWNKVATKPWTSGGLPTFFFYGSVACPYCSASSWAIQLAMDRFGTLAGTSWLHSSSSDVYANTPEVVLAGTSYTSQYFASVMNEDSFDGSVHFPPAASCVQQAYISAYDSCSSCGIPFVVIGGTYWHQGDIVNPATMGSGDPSTSWSALTPQEVQNQIDNQSGSAWNSVSAAAYLLEAIMLKVDGGVPQAVYNDPNVAAIYKQLS